MLQRLQRCLRFPFLRASSRPGTRQHATRRLRLLLNVSLGCLVLPLALLLSRVYHHLEREVFLQHRAAAEEAVRQVNQRLADLLQTEEARPFDEYSFLKVAANPLFKDAALAASPLSELPPQSAVPGVIGYFQMNPDGTLQSPVLPELDEQDLSANVDRFGFGGTELARRLALRSRLEELLLRGASERDQRRRQKQASQPTAVPAFTAAEPMSREASEREQVASDRKATRSNDAPKTALAPQGSLADTSPARQDTMALPGADAPSQSAPAQKLANSRSSPAYRERRKEQVTLPEQSTVSQVQEALDSLSSLPREAGRKPDGRIGAATQSPAEELPTKKRRTVQILTFESEVDPFQLTVLSSGQLVFFRKAWRNNVRYIQGFVAEQTEFLQQVVYAPVSTTTLGPLASLTVRAQGQQLLSRPPVHTPYDPAASAQPRQLLYNAPLEAPLDAVELAFHIGRMPRGTGATIVDALALLLGFVLIGGHYGLYRLGLQQIALAAQRSDFVSAVSHELRTPLTAIRMYGEMLRAGWVQDETRRQSYYDFIFFESERLSRLITNVLQFARLTNHDTPLVLQEYTLHQLLDVVRSKVATQAEAAGFALCFSTEGEVAATVLADEDAFVQVCINLVDNALKFSVNAPCKRVDVGVRLSTTSPPQAVLFVRDYGPGVPHNQMQRIFQLFYRAEEALTRQTRGTGIGLALVKALATRMHAQVHVCNCHPGAEFQLILPTLAVQERGRM